MVKISDRIKTAMTIREMKQSDLVRITGIGKSSISTYIAGEYEPKQRNIFKIAKALNVNEAWLMGYDVPMERLNKEQIISLPKTKQEIREDSLLDNYRKLNDIGKEEADKRVEELTQIPKYTDSTPDEPDLLAAHMDGQMTDEIKDFIDKL